MNPIPDQLRGRPFTFSEARDRRVSERMLRGARFTRVYPRVWRCTEDVLTERGLVEAARLAMPADAHLTGITRLQHAGLDFGPRRPIRFVVARDHHIALDGIFLHRTKALPPIDQVGVTVAAAFIAYCRRARVIDAIKVGSWFLHRGLMTVTELRDLALSQLWRDGAHEAIWLLDHLDARHRSLPEAETSAVITFAGLPKPEPNAPMRLDDGRDMIADLAYRALTLFLEYEGDQHQLDRGQYRSDIDRYAAARDSGLEYVQVTKEKLHHPRLLVLEVHRRMVCRGYDGPPPVFGDRWASLFLPVTVMVPQQDRRAA